MQEGWLGSLDAMLEAELAHGKLDDPFRPAVLRWAAATGRNADPLPLLAQLESVAATGRPGLRRFRWRLPVARWIPLDKRVRWRPSEAEASESRPDEHASRLWLPAVLVEHLEWLAEVAAGPEPGVAARATALLDEVTPTLEDVVAQRVGGIDAWGDTFLAWSFVRRPRALERVRGLGVAVVTRYMARAARTDGVVRGRSFPWFDTPMVSATAQLALPAARLGEGVELVAGMLHWLREERRPDGAWGDPHQTSDLLTTLAAAELLGSLDPAFEPASVVGPLEVLATVSGPRPILIGPEWPWLATELVRFAAWAERPFAERFQWPNAARWAIDPLVRVPRFEFYLALARLFEAIPALADTQLEIAFIDLANFGHWNTEHGQRSGDLLLSLLASELRRLPSSRTIRIGGDELVVVGVPGAMGLEADLRACSARWPSVARRELPGLPVVPLRAVIRTEHAGKLREASERLGTDIGPLKAEAKAPPEEGIIRRPG